jgi:hypothetical protein
LLGPSAPSPKQASIQLSDDGSAIVRPVPAKDSLTQTVKPAAGELRRPTYIDNTFMKSEQTIPRSVRFQTIIVPPPRSHRPQKAKRSLDLTLPLALTVLHFGGGCLADAGLTPLGDLAGGDFRSVAQGVLSNGADAVRRGLGPSGP